MPNLIFDITENNNGNTLILKGDQSNVVLMVVPKNPSDDYFNDIFRITKHRHSIEIYASRGAMVDHKKGKVTGFKNETSITIPKYLFPMLKEAINAIE